jgi:branched-chain amino acid transport system substrate-binding protein
LIALFCIVAGCEKPGEGGGSSPSWSRQRPSSTGPIKIGEYGSMTGSEATFGISTDNGVKLAVKERIRRRRREGATDPAIPYDDQGKARKSSLMRAGPAGPRYRSRIGEVRVGLSIAGGQRASAGVPMAFEHQLKVTQIGDMISPSASSTASRGTSAPKFAIDNLKLKKAPRCTTAQLLRGQKDDFRRP